MNARQGGRGRLRHGALGIAVVCAGLALVPAAASAEVRGGSATDAAGDTGIPQRDITATELRYDTNGTVSGKVTLAAAPDAAALSAGVGLVLGTWNGQTCTIELFAHASNAGGERAFTALLTPSGEQRLGGLPSMSAAGATVSVTATDPAIANKAWNCGGAETNDPLEPASSGDVQTVIQSLTPVAAQPGNGAKLRKAIKTCRRKHKGSKPRVKSKRKRCIRRAHKKYDAAG